MNHNDRDARRDLGGVDFGGTTDLEAHVGDLLGEFVDDYDVDGIIRDYRDAINAALRPYGVTLEGALLVGRADTDYTEWSASDIIEEIDFWSIADRHDLVGENETGTEGD